MSSYAVINVIACVGLLALAFLVAFRGARGPLSLLLALLAVDLFLWRSFRVGYELTGVWTWRRLDMACGTLASALLFHFIASFVGRARSLRLLIIAIYTLFGLIAAASLAMIASPILVEWLGTQRWSVLHLCAVLPAAAGAMVLLALHFRRTASGQERDRTRWIVTSVMVLLLLAATELAADLGYDAPRLAPVGTLASTGILAIITLRLRAFEQQVTQMTALLALAIAGLSAWAYLFVFRAFGSKPALMVAGTGAVTLVLFGVTRRVIASVALRRARMDRLATLGRFASQMAHDLKNPLAALKGAAQYLKEEYAQGRSPQSSAEFFDLLLDQIDRMHRVVDNYQRLGRAEPLRAALDVNELVRQVLALQHFAPTAKVEVRAQLTDGLPTCALDRDLVAGALENVIHNAFEAMEHGGVVTVRTAGALPPEPDGVRISVEDTGVGMDARTRERAFDDFYTTKPKGSGLGLAFVRRVVEAHGGEVTLASKEGRGTTVELRLPAR